jgi:hypothetical protein
MNERIKELAEQCTSLEVWTSKEEFDKEKFAQLIVEEAIAVVQKRFMGDLNREDMEVRRCVEDIKKHFGVEE